MAGGVAPSAVMLARMGLPLTLSISQREGDAFVGAPRYSKLKGRAMALPADAGNKRSGVRYDPKSGEGSTGFEFFRISKCTCGWLASPVMPAVATVCPRLTTSHFLTSTVSACA